MRTRPILPALFLILAGLWFLANNLGFRLPHLLDWGRIWPIFIAFVGLTSLWSYFSGRNRDPDRIFWGVAALSLGCFFFLFTLELRLPIVGRVEWSRMSELWPGFILIGGLAFLAQYMLTRFRNSQALLLAILAFVIGAVAFAFTQGFLSKTLARRLLNFWPCILIVIGLGILSRSLLRRH